MTNLNETAHKILDAAQMMVQTDGFNAFSYKDLQQEAGVKTSTMHYYFPTKQDLAAALIQRHNEQFSLFLSSVNSSAKSGIEKLQALGELFVEISIQGKFCLCGMLASDLLSMSGDGTKALQDFFHVAETWLADAIRQGIDEGDIQSTVDPKGAAAHYLATLEGGVLIARTRKGKKYMKSVVDQALLFFKK